MKIVHVSDNHGSLTMPIDRSELLTADIIVHTGDFMPNRTRGIRPVEETFQRAWLEENVERIKDYVAGNRVLYVPGNHDYIDPAPFLQAHGVDVINIADREHVENGVRFYGFPWVPWFCGEWNFEISATEMDLRFRDVPECDVLCCHSPIFGVLDRNYEGERCGSTVIRMHLQNRGILPRWFLHGHIHECGGSIQAWSRGMTVSNQATTGGIIHV